MLEKLEVVTPASQYPVDVVNIKKFLRVSNELENDIIDVIMASVRDDLEEDLGRVFLTETLKATCSVEQPLTSQIRGVVDETYMPIMRLPRVPIQAVSQAAIEVAPEDFDVLNASEWAVTLAEPTTVTLLSTPYNLLYPWWVEYDILPRVQITYTAGYATVNTIPKWMILLYYKQVAWHYANREAGGTPNTLKGDIDQHRMARI